MIERLHLITRDMPDFGHLAQAEAAVRAGVRWIQLRVKGVPRPEWLSMARDFVAICKEGKATAIINDDVQIAKLSDADGVHLGVTDGSLVEAHQVLGEEKIIGSTANTEVDLLKAMIGGADYIGVGPFRRSGTKRDLKPVLGLDGISCLRVAAQKFVERDVPLIAIGGITVDDLPDLMKVGVHGVAVSEAILGGRNPQAEVRRFLEAAISY